MTKNRLLFIAVLGAIAVVFGGIPSAYAQESGIDEFQLEEIVVTAQKRAENHQDVPIQMEVISGENLVGTEKDNIDDILRGVSNVLINKSVDGMRVSVRGLADDERTGAGDTDLRSSTPVVAINVDGAYEGSASAGQNLFDIERVEVLAGPQSTLYGSNSPGGIVNVITAAPKTDKFEGRVSTDFGNYGHFDGQVVINVPILKDKLAMRLAAQNYKRDSWTQGITNPQDTDTYRLKTLFEPNDKFSAGLTVNYSSANSGGRLGGMVRTFDYEDGHYLDGTPVTNPWTTDSYFEGALGRYNNVPSTRTAQQRTKGWRGDINVDTPIGYISFIPYENESKKSDFRNDVEIYLAADPVPQITTMARSETMEEKGAELRIVSPEDFPFKWIVGATYYDSEQIGLTDDSTFDFNDSRMTITRDNKAIYGNITYPFTDRFRGTAGYRRSWDDALMVEVPPKVKDGTTGQKYDEPDYKVGIEYDLTQESLLYASWATSYRVNTMADSTPERPVPPERLDAYTVGVKNRFLDDRIQMNASAYYYDYRNKRMHPGQDGRINSRGVILRESDYPWNGEPGTDFNNDGDYNDTNLPTPQLQPGETSDLTGGFFHDPWESQWGDFESFGVDVSFDWMITPKDLLNFSLSYINTEWVDAVDEFYWKGYFTVTPDAGVEGRSYNGLRNTYSPEWSANVGYEHRFDLGNFGTLVPVIDVQYKSDYDLSFRTEYFPFNYQESYFVLNASVAYRPSSGRWSIRGYVKNIEEYAAKTFYSQRFGGVEASTLGITDPRLHGLVFTYNFGE